MAESNQYDQLTAFSDRLKDIKQSVTASDRKAAMKELEVGYVTLCRYLNGSGTNLEIAVKLFTFFSGKISERERLLNG